MEIKRNGSQASTKGSADSVWIPPGEKHWHGATAATAMSRIAIQEKLNGSAVEWMETVTEAAYGAG
jgi:quercetin dioxygenase-like cupin family protein